MKHFYSCETAAEIIGVSVRHFRRLIEVAGVKPIIFQRTGFLYGGSPKFFFTPADIAKIRRSRPIKPQ